MPNRYGFTLPPQHMLGASLAYRLTDQLKFELTAANLTDRPNWTSNGALFHGEPSNVSASLNYRY